MPYVFRNADGRIISILSEYVDGAQEVSPNDQELVNFLRNDSPEARAQKDLVDSDLGIVRVLEDLVDVLIERGVIMFTDFPEPAQKKLLARRGLRKEFSYMDTLFAEDEYVHGEDDDGEGYL